MPLRTQLAAAGRRTVETDFSFDRRMRTILRIYRRLSPTMAAAIGQTEPVPSAENLITSCETAAF